MTDYSFEACTKDHTAGWSNAGPAPVVWQEFQHRWICLAFDREHEFQLRTVEPQNRPYKPV